MPKHAIALLYWNLHNVVPQLIGGLWLVAPKLDLREPWPIDSSGCLVTYLLFLLSGYLCGQANRIESRIAQTMGRVEELMWEDSLRRQMRAGVTSTKAMAELNITVSLAGQKPPWYQRPWGLALFGIALPMIVEVIKVLA